MKTFTISGEIPVSGEVVFTAFKNPEILANGGDLPASPILSVSSSLKKGENGCL